MSNNDNNSVFGKFKDIDPAAKKEHSNALIGIGIVTAIVIAIAIGMYFGWHALVAK